MGNQWARHFILRDFKENKTINITLFLFIFLSAWLMASGGLAIERLRGALEASENISLPPHYLQMHVGPYYEDEIRAFSDQTGMVQHMEIQKMFNVEGVNIEHEKSFSDSLLDNYFVTQNKNFDFLLDTQNKVAQMDEGEIGIPVVYSKKYGIEVGDTLKVTVGDISKFFNVIAILRDGQMGSSLASSIRFLIHEKDFDALYRHSTRQEVIVGFRLFNEADINAFSALYNSENANMPKNGVGITLPLIRLINGLGDGLMSGLIILVSGLFIVISILNIRLVLLSTLEEEAKEIGALRAIGLKVKEVSGLYRMKYKILSLMACLCAVLLSFFTSSLWLKNIALNFGLSEVTYWTGLVPVFSGLVVYGVIQLAVRRILKGLAKMDIVPLLTEGRLIKSKEKSKHPRFWHAFNKSEWALSFHEYRTHFKSWLLFLVVFFLLTLVILLPLNLYMTMHSKDFAEYVGAAKSHVRIAIEHKAGFEDQLSAVESALESNEVVEKWAAYQTLKAEIDTPNGKTSFLIEMGDYEAFPIHMKEGRLPKENGEMALSVLNANRLELKTGDMLNLTIDKNPVTYTVTGLYQDITNGGLTSKIAPLKSTMETTQSVYYVNLAPGVDKEPWVQKWSEQFDFAKVIPVEVLIDQTLGTITSSLKMSVVMIVFISSLILGLISVLFIHLKMIKNRSKDAALLAIGFNRGDIRNMYLQQAGFSILIGSLLGALTSLTFGEGLVSAFLTVLNFGMTQITFLINPWIFMGVGLLMPMAIGFVFTWFTTVKISSSVHME